MREPDIHPFVPYHSKVCTDRLVYKSGDVLYTEIPSTTTFLSTLIQLLLARSPYNATDKYSGLGQSSLLEQPLPTCGCN